MKIDTDIMNLPVEKSGIEKAYAICGKGYLGDTKLLVTTAYTIGHRDARHRAVECVPVLNSDYIINSLCSKSINGKLYEKSEINSIIQALEEII